jgi:hypothetical protein
MQELRLFAWCDVCYRERKMQEPAVNRYVITVAGVGRPGAPIVRGLDVCETHNEPVIELKETLMTAGTVVPKDERTSPTPKAPPPKVEPEAELPGTVWGRARETCRLCKTETRRDNLVAHVISRHGAHVPAQPKKCPDCGERLDKAKAMHMHRLRNHGYVYIDDVYATVR